MCNIYIYILNIYLQGISERQTPVDVEPDGRRRLRQDQGSGTNPGPATDLSTKPGLDARCCPGGTGRRRHLSGTVRRPSVELLVGHDGAKLPA